MTSSPSYDFFKISNEVIEKVTAELRNEENNVRIPEVKPWLESKEGR